MKAVTLEQVRGAVHGRWVRRGRSVRVDRVSTDSRTATGGELFFALRGERFDGHAFLPAAAAAGCEAAVVAADAALPPGLEQRLPGGVIAVADTTRALGELAAWHRAQCGAAVVAVTGSNGKTTVKRMIHHILSRSLTGSCGPKSFNNAVGVPLTLLAVRPADEYVVCELGTNAPGEIAALAALARPKVAVITSVAPAHLAGLGSLERVAAEKASIVDSLARDGLAVVWGDSDVLARALRSYDARTVRFGEAEGADLRLTGHEARGPCQRFEVNGRLWVALPLPGRHNALNALASMAVARRFGLDLSEAGSALADFPGEAMRLEWIEAGAGTIINDAYNSNPGSLAAAAAVLCDCEGRRRVLIVGDMKELGPEAEALHLQAGRDLAARRVDLVASVGSLGRYIAKGAAEAGVETAEFDSVEKAAERLGDLLRAGDAVLIKGSRAMAMEALVEPVRTALGGVGGRP